MIDLPGQTCPVCGYTRELMPSWVDFGAVFGLNGAPWRVVAFGAPNDQVNGRHSRDYVAVVPIHKAWVLPTAPCTVNELEKALAELKGTQRFYAVDLTKAVHLIQNRTARPAKL